ncbi:hypothetical protein, partial [Ureaplasma zalophigenitalium]
KSQLQKAQEAKNNIDNQKPEQLKKVIQELANALTDANNQLNEYTKNISSEKQQINDGIKQAELIKQQLANNSDSTDLKTKIDAAINATKTILDNPKSSVDELKNANQTLKTANIANSAAKKALEQTKETALDELKKEITAADTALIDPANKNKNTTALSESLRKALEVLVKADTTPASDVDNQTKELKNAIASFKSQSPNSSNNNEKEVLSTQLDKLIADTTTAQNKNDTVGLDTQELKLQLQKAQEAKNNIVNQKPEQLKKVIQELANALTDANNQLNEYTKNISSEKQQINDGIKQAELIKQQLANNSDSTDLKTKIDADITAAQNVLEKTNSTLDELKNAKETLTAANTANASAKTDLENVKRAAIAALQAKITAVQLSIQKPENKNKDITTLTQSMIEGLNTLVDKDTSPVEAVNAMTDKLQAAIQTFEAQEVVDPTAKYKELLGEKINKLISDADAVAATNAANRITDDELVQQIAAAKKMKENLENQTADEIEAQINALLNSLNDANKNLNKILDKKELLASELQKTEALLKSLKPNSDYEEIKAAIQASLTAAKTTFDQTNPTPEKLQTALDNLKTANTANAETKKTLDQEHLDKVEEYQQIYNAAIDILTDPQILDTPERQVLLGLKTSELAAYLNPILYTKTDLTEKTKKIESSILNLQKESAKKRAAILLAEITNNDIYASLKEKLENEINKFESLPNDVTSQQTKQAITSLNKIIDEINLSKKNIDKDTVLSLQNNFDFIQKDVNDYLENDLADNNYADIKEFLDNIKNKLNSIVHPSNGTKPTIYQILDATKELKSSLENAKLSKEVLDLRLINSDVPPPQKYDPTKKTKKEIIDDYINLLNESIKNTNKIIAETSEKYPTESFPNDTTSKFPKSYKELNDLNNPEKTHARKYLTFLNTELKWAQEQIKDINAIEYKNLIGKINVYFVKRYNEIILNNLENIIERSRSVLRNFALSLNHNKYKDIISLIKTHLLTLPEETDKPQYMFNEKTTLLQLNQIQTNLNKLLNSLPGEVMKIDFISILDHDLLNFIPAIESFYKENINEDWTLKLNSAGIKKIKDKIDKTKIEVLKIPSENYILIKEKTSEYNNFKNEYFAAYTSAIQYYTSEALKQIQTEKMGGQAEEILNILETISNKKSSAVISNILKDNNYIKDVKENISTFDEWAKNIKENAINISLKILQTGSSAYQLFNSNLQLEIQVGELHISDAQKKLKDFISKIEDETNKFLDYYNSSHEKITLKKFLEDIQSKDSTKPNIYASYQNFLEIIQRNKNHQNLKNRIDIIDQLIKNDSIVRENLFSYAQEYFKNNMTDDFKQKARKWFIQNSMTSILGTYDESCSSNTHCFANVDRLEGSSQNSSLDKFNKLHSGSYAYLDKKTGFMKELIDPNSELYASNALNFMNDLNLLFLKEESIINSLKPNEECAHYAYALFVLLNKENPGDIDDNFKFVLSRKNFTPDWSKRNEFSDFIVADLFFAPAARREYLRNFGFYDLISYMLQGLIYAYQKKWKEVHPDQPLDTKYFIPKENQTIQLKEFQNLTIIQKASYVLDVFGSLTFLGNLGFKELTKKGKFWMYWNEPLAWGTKIKEAPELNKDTFNFQGIYLISEEEPKSKVMQLYKIKDQNISLFNNFIGGDGDSILNIKNVSPTTYVGTKQSNISIDLWIKNMFYNLIYTYQELYTAFLELNNSFIINNEYVNALLVVEKNGKPIRWTRIRNFENFKEMPIIFNDFVHFKK